MDVEPIPRQLFFEVLQKALQVIAVLAPKVRVVKERSPRFGGWGAALWVRGLGGRLGEGCLEVLGDDRPEQVR